MTDSESHNKKVLDAGFKTGITLIREALLRIMRNVARTFVHLACINKEYIGFTGNTQTSYAAGIYLWGRLEEVAFQSDFTRAPVFRKLRKDEWKYLKAPYEGQARSIMGTVDVDDATGQMTSFLILQSTQMPQDSISVVVTTGTEYSQYLETAAHLDVLTKTYKQAAGVMLENIKTINLE